MHSHTINEKAMNCDVTKVDTFNLSSSHAETMRLPRMTAFTAATPKVNEQDHCLTPMVQNRAKWTNEPTIATSNKIRRRMGTPFPSVNNAGRQIEIKSKTGIPSARTIDCKYIPVMAK